MQKLKTVIKFEILRSLKKPSFWIAAILLPVALIGYILIAGASGAGIENVINESTSMDDKNIAILDESEILKNLETEDDVKITTVATKEEGLENNFDLFYIIPENLTTEQITIYSRTENRSLFSNYSTFINTLLFQNAIENVEPNQIVIISGALESETISLTETGEEDNWFGRLVIPIIALVIFYVLICLFGNRLLMSTVEEKENRITEMLLTSVSSKALIYGKVISLILLGFLQVLLLVIPIAILYLGVKRLAPESLGLEAIIPEIVWDPWTITTSLLLLIFGYVLFTALCVLIGAIVSSVKEASNYMGILIILVIMPIFSLGSFVSTAPTEITYLMSYFPFSAPVALLLRNAFGSLPWYEAIIGIAVIAIAGIAILYLATKVFQQNAIGMSEKFSFKNIFKSRLKLK